MHAPTLNDKCMRDSEIGSVGRVISHGLTRYYMYHEQLPVSNTVTLFMGYSTSE